MPNGHDYGKKYNGHKYPNDDGTSDCENGCGCWMGPTRSGGPVGLDPGGACPNNPEDGEMVGHGIDHEIVVTQRIRKLESRAYAAEASLREVAPGAKKLTRKLREAKTQLNDRNHRLREIRKALGNIRAR